MPNYKYTCLVTSQRDGEVPEFCLFFAPVGQVLAWAAIERIKEEGAGFQRMAVASRVRGITLMDYPFL